MTWSGMRSRWDFPLDAPGLMSGRRGQGQRGDVTDCNEFLLLSPPLAGAGLQRAGRCFHSASQLCPFCRVFSCFVLRGELCTNVEVLGTTVKGTFEGKLSLRLLCELPFGTGVRKRPLLVKFLACLLAFMPM